MRVTPTGESTTKRSPVCFVLLYHMCVFYGIIPYTETGIHYATSSDLWNRNQELRYYISSCSEFMKAEYKFGTILECVLELGKRFGHLIDVDQELRMYKLTDEGLRYIRVLS